MPSAPQRTILIALTLAVTARSEIGVNVVSFGDMKSTGLDGSTLAHGSIWNAIGMDPAENVYVVIGNNNKSGIEDCSVYKYYTATGERKLIGTLRRTAREAGTLWENEELPKGHTMIPYMNGKMYFGTQNFHEASPSTAMATLLDWYHGSHIFSIDVHTDELADISAARPDGVFQRGQGFMGLGTMPARNLVVGFSHPMGDVVLYGPDTDNMEVLPHDPSRLGQVCRSMVITPDDKVITAYANAPLSVTDVARKSRAWQSSSIGWYFWNGRVVSRDGRKIYVNDYRGQIYRIDPQTYELSKAARFGAESDSKVTLYCLAFSLDETKIYGIPTFGASGTAHVLHEYDLETGKVNHLTDLGAMGFGATYTGWDLTDSKGRVYFAWHDYGKAGIIQLDLSERSGPSPYPTNLADGRARRRTPYFPREGHSTQAFSLTGRRLGPAASHSTETRAITIVAGPGGLRPALSRTAGASR